MSNAVQEPSPWIIRAPRKEELTAVRALLPVAFQGNPAPKLTVATEKSSGDSGQVVVGAASLRLLPNRKNPTGGRFLIAVPENQRRRGIGRALLQSLNQDFEQSSAKMLIAGIPVVAGSLADSFLKACKLDIIQHTRDYLAEVSQIEAMLNPLFSRLPSNPTVQIKSLEQVARPPLQEFILTHLGGTPQEVGIRLQGGRTGFSRKHTQILVVKEVVAGASLIRCDGANARLLGLALKPQLQRTAAYPKLLEASLLSLRNAGYKTIHFTSAGRASSRIDRVASKCGAELQQELRQYGRRH